MADDPAEGIFADHPEEGTPFLLVGPATADEANTIRQPLTPIACAALPDSHFEFDSSFVGLDAGKGLKRLAILMRGHPDSPLSIFGHADPVGKDDYNKQLSGRRAAAIYALLTRKIEIWENLFVNPLGGDEWGNRAIQSMLEAVGQDPGRRDGQMDQTAVAAVKAFQEKKSLKVDGKVGTNTRRELFAAYMDVLYGDTFKQLDELKDFLAMNADAGGKGDFQGCSEFNPLRVLSKTETQAFERSSDHSTRDEANRVNRRVLVFLFKPGTIVDPATWPCPRAKDGAAGCKKRFFSDGERRRSPQEKRREYKDTQDTFACRFYDRIARDSPCENPPKFWVIRLLEDGPEPLDKRKPLANLPFSVTGVGAGVPEIRGTTDSRGVLRIIVRDDPTIMKLIVAGQEITVLAGSLSLKAVDEGVEGVVQRLQNLGFGVTDQPTVTAGQLIAGLDQFQRLHGLPVQEQPDAAVRSKLLEFHRS